jgi:hypothetical protein
MHLDIIIALMYCMIQVDLGSHPPFPLNQHFEPVVLISHDIHPFDREWNAIPSSFVNYKHHVMISKWSYVHAYITTLMHQIPLELCS